MFKWLKTSNDNIEKISTFFVIDKIEDVPKVGLNLNCIFGSLDVIISGSS
jgi:hypothetical protein